MTNGPKGSNGRLKNTSRRTCPATRFLSPLALSLITPRSLHSYTLQHPLLSLSPPMDTILATFNLASDVLHGVQKCAQDLEKTENYQKEIQASTQSMIVNLQKLVKDLERLDVSHPDGILGDITVQLKKFEADVHNVHKQLEDVNKTPLGRIDRIIRRGKNPKRIEALWEKLKSLQSSETVLYNHIST